MLKLIKDDTLKENMINELKLLFSKYSNVDIDKIGFVNNWESILNSIK